MIAGDALLSLLLLSLSVKCVCVCVCVSDSVAHSLNNSSLQQFSFSALLHVRIGSWANEHGL